MQRTTFWPVVTLGVQVAVGGQKMAASGQITVAADIDLLCSRSLRIFLLRQCCQSGLLLCVLDFDLSMVSRVPLAKLRGTAGTMTLLPAAAGPHPV